MILIVAAHPDDEVIGAASLLLRRANVRVAHLTDGAPRDLRDARANSFSTRESYAAARDAEARAALAVAGISPDRRDTLGIVDQEAPLRLAEIARSLRGLLEIHRPRLLVTHAYEGRHPDHDAAAFASHAAVALLLARGLRAPAMVEMTSCHGGLPGGLTWGVFLGGPVPSDHVHRLDAAERASKRAMLDRHATQRAALRALRIDEERFRPAPAYDFTSPPHAGPLGYESFPWGMTGERFRDLVRYALLELGLELVPAGAAGTR